MVSAFSVPKAKRQEKIIQNPGPGEYNPEISPKIVKKDPEYSFGKLERKLQTSAVPGVGSYEPKNTITNEKNPSYSMLGRKDLIKDKLNVGPGQYDPKINYLKEKAPSYSMKERSQSVIKDAPGPGHYEPKIDAYSKISGIILRDMRSSSIDNKINIGPGSYQLDKNFSQIVESSPRYGFGKDQKLKLKGDNFPGAGTYDKNNQWLKGPGKYSVGKGSRVAGISNKVPGPGSYEPSIHQQEKNKGKITFSKDQKLKQIKTNVPGPGNYDLKPFFADVPKYLLPNKS